MLKNAKSEYSDEHEEIATYQAIETLATSVGDKATAELARAIRREEERMAAFLARLIPTLAKGVVQEEVPAAERRGARGTGAKRASTAKRTGAKRPRRRRARRLPEQNARPRPKEPAPKPARREKQAPRARRSRNRAARRAPGAPRRPRRSLATAGRRSHR